MIDVDGNLIDESEIAAVTAITKDTSSFTSATCQFFIHLRGGATIAIWRRGNSDSDVSQGEVVKRLTAELTPIRQLVVERVWV